MSKQNFWDPKTLSARPFGEWLKYYNSRQFMINIFVAFFKKKKD